MNSEKLGAPIQLYAELLTIETEIKQINSLALRLTKGAKIVQFVLAVQEDELKPKVDSKTEATTACAIDYVGNAVCLGEPYYRHTADILQENQHYNCPQPQDTVNVINDLITDTVALRILAPLLAEKHAARKKLRQEILKALAFIKTETEMDI